MGKWLDDILNWCVDLVIPILLMLPESPVQAWSPPGMTGFAQIMGWVNYFVPLGAIAGILTSYLAAVLVWYGIRWFLRIVRYIE